MPLPADYVPKLMHLRREVDLFRVQSAAGRLTADQVHTLGKMLQSIVELLEKAGECCEKKSGDIVLKGKNIQQN